MVNNLAWGLDHWIYGAASGNGGTIRPADDPQARRASRSSTATSASTRRPGPSSSSPATTSSATRSTTGATGSPATSRTRSRSRSCRAASWRGTRTWRSPRRSRTSPAARCRSSGSARSRRWRQIRSSRRVAHSVRTPESAGASHHVVDAGAGVTVYRGSAYPAEFYGNVFVGDAQNNLVHRRILVPDGPTFKAVRGPREQATEFVRSSDNWFRPVNFVNAPDGTLYVLDMSRAVIEAIHIPLDVVKHLDLKRGRDQGRIYRIAPPGFRYTPPPRLSQAHDGRARRRAGPARRLVPRHGAPPDPRAAGPGRDRAAPQAARPGRAPFPPTRVNALWSLEGLEALRDEDLAMALSDPAPEVRAQAVALAARRLDRSPDLLERVLDLADDPDSRVRFRVALALGDTSDPRPSPRWPGSPAGMAPTDGSGPRCSARAPTTADRLFAELSDRTLRRPGSGGHARICWSRSSRSSVHGTGPMRSAASWMCWRPVMAARSSLAARRADRLVLALARGVRRSGGRLPIDPARAAGRRAGRAAGRRSQDAGTGRADARAGAAGRHRGAEHDRPGRVAGRPPGSARAAAAAVGPGRGGAGDGRGPHRPTCPTSCCRGCGRSSRRSAIGRDPDAARPRRLDQGPAASHPATAPRPGSARARSSRPTARRC